MNSTKIYIPQSPIVLLVQHKTILNNAIGLDIYHTRYNNINNNPTILSEHKLINNQLIHRIYINYPEIHQYLYK